MIGQIATPAASCFLTLTADQNSNLAVGNRVAFNAQTTTNTSIVLDATGNIGQCLFTGPGRYFVFGAPRALGSAGIIEARWYDVTNATLFGSIYHCATPGNSTDLQQMQPMCVCFFNLALGVNKTIELQLVSKSGTFTAWSAESWAWAMKF